MIISKKELQSFVEACNHEPHNLLGLHSPGKGKDLIARAFLRDARSCALVDVETDERFQLESLAPEGFFEGRVKGRKKHFKYRLRVEQYNGEIRQFYDPYNFLPTLSDDDLYLFNKGDDHLVYRKMGAHVRKFDEVQGVSFAVWAPSAQRVSVVGDFNGWDGRYHPMRSLGSSGVWELFIPGLQEGMKYKYEILDRHGHLHLKTDPYGSFFESPPHNASIIRSVERYDWQDHRWMEQRAEQDWREKPMSVYEVHFGSWKRKVEDGGRPFTYREMAGELTAYVKQMGFTHVEFMPLAEHPFTGSWGYQVTGFFAPTHRYGDPDDFKYLVDTLHQSDIGVIMDWVPAHFPTDAFALARFDGSALYEHEDPRQGFHQDWGTLIPNFGRHEVCNFLIGSALHWLDRYHIDGLRVDAVASMLYLDYSRKDGEWIPNKYGGNENLEAMDLLRRVNDLVHQYHPGALMIAEESTSFGGVTKPTAEGGLGFDLKWNMGWMHDTLEYFQKDPIYRKYHHHNLTFGMIYQYNEQFTQVFSHDEVVHGKGSMLMKMAAGSITERANVLRALYALMWGWPGKKTLFMGSEFGQSAEWSYDHSLSWDLLQYKDHEGIQHIVRDLNELYSREPGLVHGDIYSDGFEWMSMDDSDSSVVAFIRKVPNSKQAFLVVGHYTPVTRYGYRIGVPQAGYWKEVINSDADYYGGHGDGNLGGVETEPVAWHGRMQSLKLTLPANSTLIFKLTS
ncbi:MAG: 1,4-alpha-glucan branching protein GlgB [Opitutales bacterium]|nr:1,4-alpha-glucan branching protein GlgB [Opitutales bacterium]